MKSLNLNPVYFNRKYNRCYCSTCYASSEPDVLKQANSKYTVPRDWVAFGIAIDIAFASNNRIFQTWATVFYGTSKDKLDDIIHNRFIPFPEDDLLSNKKFILNLPDKKHVYTSPSINYASLSHVSPTDRANINGTWYEFQVVLQCKQNPTDVQKLPSGKPNACNLLPNHNIQWRTDQRSSVVPCALLIHAVKC